MRLTLRQLQVFLAVAQAKSTTAAVDVVSLSQSAVSASLNELEAMLGIGLFDRVGKRLVLNENGRLLLPQARQMLELGSVMEGQFSSMHAFSTLELQLAASTTIGIYLLPRLLAGYSAEFEVGIQPQVKVANTAEAVEAVANCEADIGFIEGACHHAAMHVEPWLRDELIIVCAPHHPLALAGKQGKVSVRLLRQAGWLLREPGSGTREAVEQALLPHLHCLNAAGQFSNSEAIKHAAAAGLGVACLSRWVVADLMTAARLVEVKTTLPRMFRNFYVVYGKDRTLSARLLAFLDFCRRWRG
ncbi:MAG: LysR family transcriptional regulator [Pseudomonadota bacterium]